MNLVRKLIKKKQDYAPGEWIFSRTACLGTDALDISRASTLSRWNIQKGRVDVLNESLEKKSRSMKRPPRRIFKNDEMWRVCSQITDLRWVSLPKPKVVIIDSFSELTDQLFTKNRTKFLSHFSDINWTKSSSKKIIKHGLLNSDLFLREYIQFFLSITKKWGEIEIVYIHFPVSFESRDEFVTRGRQLIHCAQELKKKGVRLNIIEIPRNLVKIHPDEENKQNPFPYHYDESTIAYVADEINKILSQLQEIPERLVNSQE